MLVTESQSITSREETIEEFIHARRTANPHSLDVFGAKLLNLLSNELLVPSLWIDVILRQSDMQAETWRVDPLTIGME